MPRTDEIQMEERVRMVITWILNGYFTKDIISQITTSWKGVGERMAYKYIKKARNEIKEVRAKETEDLIAWHQAARLKLYNGLDGKKTASGAFAAMDILKDMAKIDQLYVEKHKLELDNDVTVIIGAKKISKD